MTQLPEGTKMKMRSLPAKVEVPVEETTSSPEQPAAMVEGIWNGNLPGEVVHEVAQFVDRSLMDHVQQVAVNGGQLTAKEIFSHVIVQTITATSRIIRERYVADALNALEAVVDNSKNPTPESQLVADRAVAAFAS